MAEQFYFITFESTTHGMQTQKLAKKTFSVAMMPAPRELTVSCGIALKFLEWKPEEIEPFFGSLSIPCRLYRMGVTRVNGVHPIELIKENKQEQGGE